MYSAKDNAINKAKDFVGTPFYDVQKISKFRRAVDLKLEVHPFPMALVMCNDRLADDFFSIRNNDGVSTGKGETVLSAG